MPPLAGSWPYSGSLEEPPFSSLNAELADISAADDAERRRAETESRDPLRGAEADRAGGARMRARAALYLSLFISVPSCDENIYFILFTNDKKIIISI